MGQSHTTTESPPTLLALLLRFHPVPWLSFYLRFSSTVSVLYQTSHDSVSPHCNYWDPNQCFFLVLNTLWEKVSMHSLCPFHRLHLFNLAFLLHFFFDIYGSLHVRNLFLLILRFLICPYFLIIFFFYYFYLVLSWSSSMLLFFFPCCLTPPFKWCFLSLSFYCV